ncbi:UvrD-helicase domain-containing protein [Streptomyces sp. Q6]|uniref:UvrD-helicase domain-containing protein n=1 Tax=Streptomyces citrinus TaxID=3118173 RepID=A0ACD5AKI1_9ACTN
MPKRARRRAVLLAEQRSVDHAYECLEQTRQEATDLKAVSAAASGKDAIDVNQAWQRELEALDLGGNALVFLRADVTETTDGERETYYIGRRTVRDAERNRVVLSWTAPAAIRWRLTDAKDPGEVALLRQLVCQTRKVKRYLDLHGAEPDREPSVDDAEQAAAPVDETAAESDEFGWHDHLLEELGRARDGAMHDIVETIQREQLLLVAEKPEGVLVVQGGPGTGKTAVAMHRVRWLLDNQHTTVGDLLVVGPNRGFLEYVGSALGELGANGVSLLELPALWSGAGAPRDIHNVAAVKSGPGMEEVLRRAVDQQVTTDPERLAAVVGGPEFTFELRNREVSISVAELAETAAHTLAGSSPYQVRRERFRQQMVQRLTDAYIALLPGPADIDYFEVVLGLKPVTRLLRRIAPELTAAGVYRRLLTDTSALASAAGGTLSAEEQSLLRDQGGGARGGAQQFSLEDLVCLDELEHILTGRPDRTYGHIVIDEAQDLTPMQARSLARRCPSGAMTVVGDLAQATGPVPYENWDQLGGLLARRNGWRLAELRTGFRVPGEVMEFVRLLGEHCAPGVTAPDSVRQAGTEVAVMEDADPVGRAVMYAVEQAADDPRRTVAVIVPADGEWREKAAAAVSGYGEISVLTPEEAKGLEFDHVAVVEPTAVADSDPAGPCHLYVALTRCTQSLAVTHRSPLPVWLGGPATVPGPSPKQLVGRLQERTAAVRPGTCSRFHADGTRCVNGADHADGWCRQPECGGFRTAEPMSPGKAGYLSAPRDAESDHRLELVPDDIALTRIESSACAAFTARHGGDRAEAAVELHSMLRPFLAEGKHHRTKNTWYLDLDGYRLVLDPGSRAVIGYHSGHPERSYSQFTAGVPSRVGKEARAARRSALTRPWTEPGTPLDEAAARGIPVAGIHLARSACQGYERIHRLRVDPDDSFLQRLREDLASDLGTGTIHRVGNRMVVDGERNQWIMRADGEALLSVRQAGAEIDWDPATRATCISQPTNGSDMSLMSTQGLAEVPDPGKSLLALPLSGLEALVSVREQSARADRSHEGLRHRLLGELFELDGDVGHDGYVDAWHLGPEGLTLFEAVATESCMYTDLREAALHLLESAALRQGGQPEYLVAVLRDAPAEPWAVDAVRQAFGVEVAWRDRGGWGGPGARRIIGAGTEQDADR